MSEREKSLNKNENKQSVSTNKTRGSKEKNLINSNNSTNILTSNSPAYSNSHPHQIKPVKPFKIRNLINAVKSPKLSEQLHLSVQNEGLLSSKLETQSLIKSSLSPFNKNLQNDQNILERKAPSHFNVQSENVSRSQFQPTSLLKSVHAHGQYKDFQTVKSSNYNTFNPSNTIYAKTTHGFSKGFEYVSQSITSSKMNLNSSEVNNWNQAYDTSIDESYSIINLNEVSSHDIQFNLKKQMKIIANQFGFHLIDFKVNFIYLVFVKNFNACFYQSSNIKNFCNSSFYFIF